MARVEIGAQEFGTIIRNGQPVPNTTVQIATLAGPAATHWSAVTGGSSSTANLSTDVDGVVGLGGAARFIEEGTYNVTVNGTTRRVEAVSGTSLAPVFNVITGYGAAGDGIADDTAEIQAAIDAASTAGGGVVFLPTGTYSVGQLQLKSRVELRGTGNGSILFLKNATNAHVLVLSSVQQQFTKVRSLRIRGNRTNQTGNWNGIHYDNTGFTDALYADPHHLVEQVTVDTCSGHGVYLTTKASECRFRNVHVDSCTLDGFHLAWADNFFESCTAAACGRVGYWLEAACSNTRFAACKAFYNGSSMAASTDRGEGWYIAGIGNEFSACESQDNWGHGVTLDTAQENVATAFGSETNGQFAGLTTAAGFYFTNSQRNQLVAFSSGNRSGFTRQDYGVYFNPSNVGQGNRVEGNCYANNTGAINVWSSASNVNNDVALGASRGMQRLSANVAPDILNGGICHYVLTGNHTQLHVANRWFGMRVTFIFQQDATGGRTITFTGAANFKVNAAWAPALTANKADVITFLFDGTNYWQESCSIGVG